MSLKIILLKLLPNFLGDNEFKQLEYQLTLKHRETHGCVVSIVATDALVLKHQAISNTMLTKHLLYWTSFI